jgi:glucose repression regulatory protein TUP1
METGQNILTVSIRDGVSCVAISPDVRFLAAGSLDRKVRVWDTEMGTLMNVLEGHKDSVWAIAFSPSGLELLSGSLDNTMKLWEFTAPGRGSTHRAMTCKTTYVGHKAFVVSVAWSPDGRWVMSGSKDKSIRFWNPVNAQPQIALRGHGNSGTSHPICSDP